MATVVDVSLSVSQGETGWLNEGLGKLRYDESDDGLNIAYAGLDIAYLFDTKHKVQGTLIYNNDADAGVDISELFYQYRALSTHGGKNSLKAGVFFPPFSLENTGIAWRSNTTTTPSVINSWVGEEFRVFGLEASHTWPGLTRQSANDIKLSAAVFYNNDPVGAMLAWRGWVPSARVSTWNDELPVPAIPFFSSGTEQKVAFEPFKEVDDRPGGYVSVQLKRYQNLALQLAYYHNNGDPSRIRDGQYAWRTRFFSAGFERRFKPGWQLSGQWMSGKTLMQTTSARVVVDNRFDAAYLTLTKKLSRHKFVVRAEYFSVEEFDNWQDDDNDEHGNILTLGYAYRFPNKWKLAFEFQRIDSNRDARRYLGESIAQLEYQTSLVARYFWRS